jgi:hypothetical protein
MWTISIFLQVPPFQAQQLLKITRCSMRYFAYRLKGIL